MVESSELLKFLANLVVVVGVVFLAYVLLKSAAGSLVNLVIWSNTDSRDTDRDAAGGQDKSGESEEYVPGLHVLSDYGAQHSLVDKNPTEATIRETIRSLDWVEGFHQVLLVTSPGVCLEVGGSLDPDDGLSSAYSDRNNAAFKVINKPPRSVEHMEDLLVSFYRGDGRWEQLNVYE